MQRLFLPVFAVDAKNEKTTLSLLGPPLTVLPEDTAWEISSGVG